MIERLDERLLTLSLLPAAAYLTLALCCGTAAADERPTLEQIKQSGALQSSFRNHELRHADAVNPQPKLREFRSQITPILQSICVDCHGSETQEGNLRIDTLDPDLLHGADVDWWLEILGVLSNGEMPPPDEVELADGDRNKLIEWLAGEIQVASTVRRAAAGHSSFRRMTRYEYNYALQDLLRLPWDFARDLPPEATSDDGFQNSSEVLQMSPMQLETYRQLARKALMRATVHGDPPSVLHWAVTMKDAAKIDWAKQTKQLEEARKKFKDNPDELEQELCRLAASFHKPHRNTYYRELSTGRTARATWAYGSAKYAFTPTNRDTEIPVAFDHVAVIPQGRNRKLTVELGDQVPDEGTMRVRVRASRTRDEDKQIPSLQLEFGWQASNEGRALMRVSQEDILVAASPNDPEIYQWDIELGEIYPRNSVRNVSQMGAMPNPSEYVRLVNSSAALGDIQIDYVEITAPVYDPWPPESHRRLFFESANRNDEPVYAREVLTSFMSRAWRRGISRAEVDQKMELFQAMRGECETFEAAIVEVLATVLSSPNFLYVVRDGIPSDADARNRPHSLAADELATRLSMFLWCSVPDTRLLDLARTGRLVEPEILADEVSRMLADRRSSRLSKHFVHQWLDLQLLDFLKFDASVDPLTKEAMHHEPIALFDEMVRNDESVLNFIHANYTMANERLARHYGLPGVLGNHFRRVALDPSPVRGGLLTQAGLLAMNSDGTDSHPLKRGIWLLESLLNDPPPPPPPAVPEIDLTDPEIAKLTLKQRIEDHRDHAACMSCHAKIDPWGIAFENYDALGRWRDQVNGKPVDASSRLFNNQQLNGMDGLKRFLLENRQDQFVRALVHKMMTYALGRPLTFADRSSIDQVTADVRDQGDGLATMIRLVATSELFQSK